VIKIGLIGPGKWGKNIIKSINKVPGLEISYICSQNKTSEHSFISDFKYTADWKKLIESNEVDAVVISSPPDTHYEMLSYAISKKKPTFVEKPHCLTSIDAKNILQDAERNQSIVIIDYIYLHHSLFRDLKKKINKENKQFFAIRTVGGNNGPFRRDIGVLWDYGPHDIAMCIDLVKEYPSSINAFYDSREDYSDGKTIYIELKFEVGAIANIKISNQLQKKERIFEVKINDISYMFDDTNSSVDKNKKLEKSPLENALIKFRDKILKQKKYLDDLKLGLFVNKILEECEKNLN